MTIVRTEITKNKVEFHPVTWYEPQYYSNGVDYTRSCDWFGTNFQIQFRYGHYKILPLHCFRHRKTSNIMTFKTESECIEIIQKEVESILQSWVVQ
jgi:hypothetical protein